MLSYGGFEARYVLPGACCAWLAGMATLDASAGRALVRRWRDPSPRRALLARVTVIVTMLGALAVEPRHVVGAHAALTRALTNDRPTRLVFRNHVDAQLRRLCRHISRDHVAIAVEAEALHFWCGAPTMRLPPDLGVKGVLAKFVKARGVKWIVLPKPPPKKNDPFARVRTAATIVKRVARTKDLELYEVHGKRAPKRPAWRRPPPALAALP